MKCGREIPSGDLPYRSSFVSRVVESSCSHQRAGSLCSDCDMDMVFRIIRREEACFNRRCNEVLRVDKSLLVTALSKFPKLLDEYDQPHSRHDLFLWLIFTLAFSRLSVVSVSFAMKESASEHVPPRWSVDMKPMLARAASDG